MPGNSDKGYPNVARCCGVHQRSRSKIRIAWTIFKLKCVRGMLSPLIKAHVWWHLREQKKVSDGIINSGQAKPKQGQEDTNAKL